MKTLTNISNTWRRRTTSSNLFLATLLVSAILCIWSERDYLTRMNRKYLSLSPSTKHMQQRRKGLEALPDGLMCQAPSLSRRTKSDTVHQTSEVCRNFQRFGACKFSNKCKFLHVVPPGGHPGAGRENISCSYGKKPGHGEGSCFRKQRDLREKTNHSTDDTAKRAEDSGIHSHSTLTEFSEADVDSVYTIKDGGPNLEFSDFSGPNLKFSESLKSQNTLEAKSLETQKKPDFQTAKTYKKNVQDTGSLLETPDQAYSASLPSKAPLRHKAWKPIPVDHVYSASKPSKFLIDSGATCHIVENEQLCYNVRPASLSIKVGGNNILQCHKVGMCRISFSFKGNTSHFTLKDVGIVHSFGGNIISVSKFVDAGCLVTKQNGILKIFHQKTNKLFLEAPIKHGLAYLPDAQGITLPSASKMNSPSTAMLARQYTSSNMKDLELLHQRLGHVNFQEAARLTGMKPPSKPIFCEPCVQGKSTRYPLGTPSAGVPPLNDSPRSGYLI